MIVVATVSRNSMKRLRAVRLLGTHQQTHGLQMFHTIASHVARLLLLPDICSRSVVVADERQGELVRGA